MKGTTLRVVLALASAGAGVIHLVVIPEHLEEFAPFGWGFLALGAFQLLWAGAIVLAPSRPVLFLGVIVSALTVGVWILSRTSGLPVGPEAGEPEPIGTLDALASALEGVIVLGGAFLLTSLRTGERPAQYPPAAQERRAA
jgi:hypothetical protein